MMDRICVVPEDPEVLCGGFKCCKSLNGLIRIGISLGIRILGNAPDSLYGLVAGYVLFHHIHIGALGSHGNRDHLDAEMLAYCKMSVISGCRAEELHLIQLAPGSISAYSVGKCSRYGIIHYIKRSISAYDDIFGRGLHYACHELLCFGDTVKLSVISGIYASGRLKIACRIDHIKEIHPHIEL